jgi:hypothetical protein
VSDPGPWLARIEGVLQAHFSQSDGTSRPGADYAIGLQRGEQERKLMVRAFLADGVAEATRRDTAYQGRTVIGYVFDRIEAGWDPAGGEDLPPLTILDPLPGQATSPPKDGWLKRLLGRG